MSGSRRQTQMHLGISNLPLGCGAVIRLVVNVILKAHLWFRANLANQDHFIVVLTFISRDFVVTALADSLRTATKEREHYFARSYFLLLLSRQLEEKEVVNGTRTSILETNGTSDSLSISRCGLNRGRSVASAAGSADFSALGVCICNWLPRRGWDYI